jgi:GntR family transcriptional regulator
MGGALNFCALWQINRIGKVVPRLPMPVIDRNAQNGFRFIILKQEYNVELGYADEEVDATAADPRTAELLEVPRREPLLRIRQVIYSKKGTVILYVLGLYRSDRHNLVIRRFR